MEFKLRYILLSPSLILYPSWLFVNSLLQILECLPRRISQLHVEFVIPMVHWSNSIQLQSMTSNMVRLIYYDNDNK
jgi:hypothetical protein